MDSLRQYRPALASVLDWEREDQWDEIWGWAQEASQYVTEAVIIIPKVQNSIDRIPREVNGKQVRLGYSVPTKFSGTSIPQVHFRGWPVHLLGGSPQRQYELAQYLNVQSADGNYIQKMALLNLFFSAGNCVWSANRRFPQLQESVFGRIDHDSHYFAFELSCMNIRAMWTGCQALIRFGVESDVPVVQKIAYQWRDQLGRVMRPALLESAARRSLYVAEIGGKIVGFANCRQRRDGVTVIYEIAVDQAYLRYKVGTGLVSALPQPVRLKVTTDNVNAQRFYESLDFVRVGQEDGRKRPLFVYSS